MVELPPATNTVQYGIRCYSADRLRIYARAVDSGVTYWLAYYGANPAVAEYGTLGANTVTPHPWAKYVLTQ